MMKNLYLLVILLFSQFVFCQNLNEKYNELRKEVNNSPDNVIKESRILKENDIDSISYENEKEFLRNHDNTSYLIPDVRKVRSVNAAFDPKKAKSSNQILRST